MQNLGARTEKGKTDVCRESTMVQPNKAAF